jgi:hypothetical protein
MNDAYGRPQPCPLCCGGPFAWPQSLRRHVDTRHAGLSARARAELAELTERIALGQGPPGFVDVRLTYARPSFCPRCERGPFAWPPSLWLHAYGYHGFLSHRELAEIMDAAYLRSKDVR